MRLPAGFSNHRGDTIVEVLIALMIISLILVGAYNVSNRSIREVRTSQEHSALQLLLQGQIERVRALARDAANTDSGIFTYDGYHDGTPKYFCLDTNGAIQPFNDSIDELPTGQHVDMSVYPDKCKDIEGLYAIAATYDSADNKNVFRFYGSWDTLGGSRGSEQLDYRIYPGGSTQIITTSAAIWVPPPGCDVPDPITGKCKGGGGPKVPHWNRQFGNNSDNPGLTVLSCTWDFGDGVVETYPGSDSHCMKGTTFKHEYEPPSSSPPASDPYWCSHTRTITATLTMYFQNGKPASDSKTKTVPNCYSE